MRSAPWFRLATSLVLAGLAALPAAAQRSQPIAAHRPPPRQPAAWARVDYERRAAVLRGVQRGGLAGMLVGTVAGTMIVGLSGDDGGGAFTVLGGGFGGLALGGLTGGIVAARRYDRRHGQPPNVALHLTGRPRTVPSSGEPLSRPPSFRLHGARR